MINISRIKWAIEELKEDEEYIQWVLPIVVKVHVGDDLAYIQISKGDIHSRKVLSIMEIKHAKFDLVSHVVNEMVDEINEY